MSFVYTLALEKLLVAGLNLSTADVRALLVMSDTTALTDTEAEFIADFGTLDEYDGAAYARQALATEAVSVDAGLGGNFTSDPIVFATLGVGTRQAVGLILFKFVTNDADSIPLLYIDLGGFPFDGNGEDVTITPDAAGWALTRNAA